MKLGTEVINEQCSNLVEESLVECCIDLGHAFMYKLIHPKYGKLVVLNSVIGKSGVVTI
jgi:hypothetical protein